MKNTKSLIGLDWEGRTFQPERKVNAKTFSHHGLIIINMVFVVISNKMGTKDTLGDSEGTWCVLFQNQEVLGNSIPYLLPSAIIPLNRLLCWETKPNFWFYN